MKLGDSHNGKCVSLVQRGGLTLVNKPRCIFWEYLFLDPTSTLRQLIKGNTTIDLDSILGQIAYSSEDNFYSGDAEFISASLNPRYNLSQIGEVAAFALAFGFGDLHGSNLLVASNNSLQIIDLECVFNSYDLLQSTLISPAKWNFDSSKTILQKICDDQGHKLSWRQLYEFLSSFILAINQINSYSRIFVDHFNVENKIYSKYPIRILLRPTAHYQEALNSKKVDQEFLPEEISQLVRGDIPYFWGYLGDSDVYWGEYMAPKKLISNTFKIESLRQKSFKSLDLLLEKTRLEGIILNVTAELVKNILDQESENNLKHLITLEKVDLRVLVKLPQLGIQVKY